MSTFYSTLNFTGNTSFRDNTAILGGGICTSKCILGITEDSTDNIMEKDSGGYNSFTFVFMDNSALVHGGAVYTKDSTLKFEAGPYLAMGQGGNCPPRELDFLAFTY